ncbi:MAG: integrase arm-type DNA-binding domain-containing protein [Pseudomonadota bacterium]
MARAIHKLSDVRVKSLTNAGRHSDGGGLYLRVKSGGAKSWAFIFEAPADFEGKRKRREMGLGRYPDLSLSQARQVAHEHRQCLAGGGDPLQARVVASIPTFEKAVALFLEAMSDQWSNEKHRYQWAQTLGPQYCASLAKIRVDEIGLNHVMAVLNPIWLQKPETATRLRGRIERVLNFAKVSGWRSGENPAIWRGNLDNVLPKPRKLVQGHHAAMPWSDLPAFIDRLKQTEGMAAIALRFAILSAGRTGEVLGAKWDEVDFDASIWSVPAVRMKTRKEHRVPLTEPMIDLIRPLYDGRVSEYIFPGARYGRPLSNMAMSMLLRRMGETEITVHGFRSSFRDWAGDQTSFPRDIAEGCLAHLVGSEIERAYRRSDALEKRRKLMEAWGHYLTGHALGSVVALHG